MLRNHYIPINSYSNINIATYGSIYFHEIPNHQVAVTGHTYIFIGFPHLLVDNGVKQYIGLKMESVNKIMDLLFYCCSIIDENFGDQNYIPTSNSIAAKFKSSYFRPGQISISETVINSGFLGPLFQEVLNQYIKMGEIGLGYRSPLFHSYL
jgi:hypothetical protein